MRIPVLIEPVKDDGFRASGPGADEVVGEGRTDTEALLNLRKAIESRIRAGAKLTYLAVGIDGASLEPAASVFERSRRRVSASHGDGGSAGLISNLIFHQAGHFAVRAAARRKAWRILPPGTTQTACSPEPDSWYPKGATEARRSTQGSATRLRQQFFQPRQRRPERRAH